jgi:hypothetical protein
MKIDSKILAGHRISVQKVFIGQDLHPGVMVGGSGRLGIKGKADLLTVLLEGGDDRSAG